MEPYHQLRFPSDARALIERRFRSDGINYSYEEKCWLPHLGFQNLRCSCGDQRSLFAIGADAQNADFTLFVYPNILGNDLTVRVRTIAESCGAIWGYFHKPE